MCLSSSNAWVLGELNTHTFFLHWSYTSFPHYSHKPPIIGMYIHILVYVVIHILLQLDTYTTVKCSTKCFGLLNGYCSNITVPALLSWDGQQSEGGCCKGASDDILLCKALALILVNMPCIIRWVLAHRQSWNICNRHNIFSLGGGQKARLPWQSVGVLVKVVKF